MSVQVTRLANGLTVASDHMASIETVSVGAWVGSGTRHETAEVNGIAHLLEHMAFKGTARRSAFDIAEEIEAVGGHLNAYTSRECTAYYARVLAEDAPLAVDLVGDILQNPTFEEIELQRERSVVLQEIGQAWDTPDDVVFDHFQKVAYPDQGLGRPVLGEAAIIDDLGSDALRGFMRRSYGFDRMVFTAAGNLEHQRLVDMVGAAFADARSGDEVSSDPADYRGGELREERDLEQVHLVMGFDGAGYLDPDYYPFYLLSTLFGGGMSSRLFQEVREKRGLVYSVYSFLSSYLDGGTFAVYAGTGKREAAEVIPVICDEINALSKGIGADELARAKSQLRAAILMGRESSSARCETLAQQILTFGRPVSTEEMLSKVAAVELGDLQRVVSRLLESRPAMAAVGPLEFVEPIEEVQARLG